MERTTLRVVSLASFPLVDIRENFQNYFFRNPLTGLGSENEPRKFNNCIYKPKNNVQLLVSNEINNLRDQSSLYYLHPKQNGYTLNWDVQRTIYEHLFYDTVC